MANNEFRLVLGRTRIDYDPEKDLINRKKHGYALESGVDILSRNILPIVGLSGLFLIKEVDVAGERRQNILGPDDEGRLIFMVTTMRSEDTVRIISFRTAHEIEREQYAAVFGGSA